MDPIFQAIERGAVVVTRTRRLARVLAHDYSSWQRDRGKTLWATPPILPLDAYLRKLWREDVIERGSSPMLLTEAQDACVWERIARASRFGSQLLQVEAAARHAIDAWRLVQQYRIPLDGRFAVSEDCEAFLEWAREYETVCRESKWLDPARLPGFVIEHYGSFARQPAIYAAGFEELSPVESQLFTAMNAEAIAPPLRSAVMRTRACATADDEIQCAAEWARGVLKRNQGARIGIAVLDLVRLRAKVERIFREVLQPGVAPASEAAFHVSLGKPLAEYAMIRAALLILPLSTGGLEFNEASVLLRSPYVRQGETERSARAMLDARLRKDRTWEITFEAVRQHLRASRVPELHGFRTHSQWSRALAAILGALGWPGDRPLDTHEHQLVARWNTLLGEFASLDAVSSPVDLNDAVRILAHMAGTVVFQFEDTGAPVQISDPSEMAGIGFDHLWAMGLHDEAFPPAASPNPFLPIAVQLEKGMPHSSAKWEHDAARRCFDRLSSSAGEVLLSYPRLEADRMLAPSPFLNPAVSIEPQARAWVDAMRSSAALEAAVDECAPPIPEDAGVRRGGSGLLRDVAACPFRAFAKYRLGARELQDPEPGLSAADKGNAVHQILHSIWGELRSHTKLLELSPQERSELVARHVDAVVDRFGSSVSTRVEKIRLRRLISAWLDFERGRSAFDVVCCEETREIDLAGLMLEIRVDRVDELPDGRRIILDYKTGKIESQGWSGDRPDEPQVPLYCVSSQERIAGAAFAQVQSGDLRFKGILCDEALLPGFKCYVENRTLAIQEHVEQWRAALTALAQRFRGGDARVDPKRGSKTCEYCAVTSLCRVQDGDEHD